MRACRKASAPPSRQVPHHLLADANEGLVDGGAQDGDHGLDGRAEVVEILAALPLPRRPRWTRPLPAAYDFTAAVRIGRQGREP